MAGSSPPRIAFLINELRYRGAQRVLVDDANRFSRAGVHVLFFTLYRQSDVLTIAAELDAGIEHVILEARGPFDVRAVARCAALLRSRGIQVLVTTLNHGNIVGRWVALASGLRIRLFRRESNTPSRKPLWQRALDVLFDGIPHRILAVTEDVRQDLVRLTPWRARKVILVSNAGPDPVSGERPRRDAPVILSVGRLTAQKDHAALISALGALARRGVAFTAQIVGDGERYDRLLDHARTEGVADRVTFRRILPHHEVLHACADADIFVLSSEWEGCPNVVLEAMAHGIPIVATAVGGVPELVENGVSGLLVPPRNPEALADALARLTNDEVLRTTMGHAARTRSERFAPAARFERLYRLVTADGDLSISPDISQTSVAP